VTLRPQAGRPGDNQGVRATLIVNPYASSVTEKRVREVERELSAGYELETILTERRGHATELAHRADGDAILAFGGDGVANEVLNGVDGSRPVGFLPGGGTSVLARALGLPHDPVAAARKLVGAQQRRISLGRANGRRFGFAAGIGLDSEAVRRVDALGREGGRRPGDLTFARVIAGIVVRSGRQLKDALEVRGAGRAALIVVSKDAVFTYAGSVALRFCPEARFELGLDYAALSNPGAAQIARAFFRAARGHGLAGVKGALTGHDLDRIQVVCDRPSPLQLDGEDLGDVEEVVFECERGAVSVLA
jgi:diacylglycerol kinase family enzyme